MKSLNYLLNTYFNLSAETRSDIAKRSSPIEDLCALHMYASSNRVEDAVEVGTFKGLSAVFIAAAISGRLNTVNINPKEVSIAKDTAKKFGIENINFFTGDSIEQLPVMIENISNLSFAYIDGYHSYEYCMAEYKLISPRMDSRRSAIFIDDATKNHPDGAKDGGVPKMVDEINALRLSVCGSRIACKLTGSFSLI